MERKYQHTPLHLSFYHAFSAKITENIKANLQTDSYTCAYVSVYFVLYMHTLLKLKIVYFSSLTDNQLLKKQSSTQLWKYNLETFFFFLMENGKRKGLTLGQFLKILLLLPISH